MKSERLQPWDLRRPPRCPEKTPISRSARVVDRGSMSPERARDGRRSCRGRARQAHVLGDLHRAGACRTASHNSREDGPARVAPNAGSEEGFPIADRDVLPAVSAPDRRWWLIVRCWSDAELDGPALTPGNAPRHRTVRGDPRVERQPNRAGDAVLARLLAGFRRRSGSVVRYSVDAAAVSVTPRTRCSLQRAPLRPTCCGTSCLIAAADAVQSVAIRSRCRDCAG